MFKKFKPDFTFGSYAEVTPTFLLGENIHALLIDIDNTLAPYEQSEPDEKLLAWFSELERSGIKAALVSNNHADRVDRFNARLGLPAYADCGKPSRKTIRKAAESLGVDISRCAVMGDQLFTDAFAGKRLGMRAIIVPPIKDKKTLFFKFKRSLEKPIMRSYEKDLAKRSGNSK